MHTEMIPKGVKRQRTVTPMTLGLLHKNYEAHLQGQGLGCQTNNAQQRHKSEQAARWTEHGKANDKKTSSPSKVLVIAVGHMLDYGEIIYARINFSFVLVTSARRPSLRALRAGQQERVIRPRLAFEARKLLRRILPWHERADLVNTARESLSLFWHARREAAALHPIIQRAELNKGRNQPLFVNMTRSRGGVTRAESDKITLTLGPMSRPPSLWRNDNLTQATLAVPDRPCQWIRGNREFALVPLKYTKSKLMIPAS
ncbi:hypothetical protein EDB85DRAFT_2275124 [Lactarius pseudohatsudake]|nr:hypothetical protein EDB85DRAFT_2275124 [Lactarius pseudohatsudake]